MKIYMILLSSRFFEDIIVLNLLKFIIIWLHGVIKGMHRLRNAYNEKVFDITKFGVFLGISFMEFKGSPWSSLSYKRREMRVLLERLSERLTKVDQAYSRVGLVNWWLTGFGFSSILGMWLYMMYSVMPLLPLISYSFFKPFVSHWNLN